MAQGWIKIHRKLKEWEWYTCPNMIQLFMHMLLRANHKPNRWKGIEIESGQFVSGRKALSLETGISEQSIRTAIINLQKSGELTIKSTSKHSIFTLVNWGIYQNDEEANQPTNHQSTINLTNSQPATNQQLTTNKNDKKEKNDKKKEVDTFDYFSWWNEIAAEVGLGKIIEFSNERKRKVKTRRLSLKIDLITKELKSLNDFTLNGGWLTFDWLIYSDKNLNKLLEGNYRNKKKKAVVNRDRWQFSGICDKCETEIKTSRPAGGNVKSTYEQCQCGHSVLVERVADA